MVADDLYALRPEEFVAGRTALAKQLRADGRKDEAAAVAKLRRPSAAAWALNQVARRDPKLVEVALEAGAALRAATDQAVAGKPGELRAATTAERAAANAVVKAAAQDLGPRADALGPALLATIRVASLDDEVADQLRRGVLASDQEQPGFGFGMDGEVASSPPPTRARAKSGSARATRAPAEAEPDKAARVAARAAARAEARERTERQRTADRKAREAARLAREADEAEALAREARAAADTAHDEAEAARAALDELSAS